MEVLPTDDYPSNTILYLESSRNVVYYACIDWGCLAFYLKIVYQIFISIIVCMYISSTN